MISILIPARNEEQHLPRLFQRLQEMAPIQEIIVADGGSTDGTVEIAQRLGARVVQGARGRGPQQNLAASISTGEVLWFLHADCLPSRGSGTQIERAVQRGAIGGNFRILFEASGFWPRLFAHIARWQRRLGVYYGDSGIWMMRETWEELGGFEEWPLFEDLELAQRLEKLARRKKKRTVCCAGRLRASARRFERAPLFVLWLWLRLQWAYERGASPAQLASIYHGETKW